MCSRHNVLFSAVLLLGMTSLRAQGLVTQPFPQPYPSVSFQFQRPDFNTSRGIEALSGAFELAGSYPVTEDIILSAKLPLGMFSTDDRQAWVLGNIGLGVTSGLYSNDRFALAGSLLMNLKTSPSINDDPCNCSDAEFASFVGWYADPYQAQRFTQRHWRLGGILQAEYKPSSTVTLGAELGPQWYLPTRGSDRSYLDYNSGLHISAGTTGFRGIAEYVAILTTLSVRPFGPFTYEDMVGFGLQVITTGPDFTVYYQVLLNSGWEEIVNGSYGFRLNWPIGEKEAE